MRALKIIAASLVIILGWIILKAMYHSTETSMAETAKKAAFIQAATPEQLRLERKKYAEDLDLEFIDEGIESKTTTMGPADTTLKIKYALLGRVAADRFGRRLNFKQLKSIGFKKVFLTNDFSGALRESYSWPVE